MEAGRQVGCYGDQGELDHDWETLEVIYGEGMLCGSPSLAPRLVHNSCSINAMLFIFYVNFKNVFIITFLSMGKCYLRKKMIVDIFLNKSIRGRRRRG